VVLIFYVVCLFGFILYFMYPMVSVSLDFLFLIAPSVFSNVYLVYYPVENPKVFDIRINYAIVISVV
jgi:hypothetical protein